MYATVDGGAPGRRAHASPARSNRIRERNETGHRKIYWQWTEEVLITEASGLLPSQVTGHYWVYAVGPAYEADASSTGKWLVFVPGRQIDRWWEQIRLATEQGCLGISAKAATACHNDLATSARTKLICVYTRDWQDQDDVRRASCSS